MAEINRKHKRIKKPVTMRFCLSDASVKKWDMTIIDNISAGGVKFAAPTDLDLFNKIIKLQIKIPEMAPHILELEAVVLSVQNRPNPGFSDVRAKFINLSVADYESLSVLENIINKT